MKVYVVIQSLWEDWEIKGVYDSLEKAQDNIKKAVEQYTLRNDNEYEYKLIETDRNYSIRRIKKYEFSDGLVNDIPVDNFTIIEKELNKKTHRE